MNSDSIYVIGHTHEVCQDFALNKEDRIVISDGCSSSPMTNIGSTLLSIAAMTSKKEEPTFVHLSHIIGSAEKMAKAMIGEDFLPMDYDQPNMLDATLITGFMHDGRYIIHGSGDGVVCVVGKNGGKAIYNFHFPSGYPNYMAYTLSQSRESEIIRINEGKIGYTRTVLDKDNITLSVDIGMRSPTEWDVFIDPLLAAHASIFSDGILSFDKKVESETSSSRVSQDFIPLVLELTNFKTTPGSFLKRAHKGFKKYCERNGLKHNDDLSIASVVF